MPEESMRERVAALIPLGFTERDPYANVFEVADAILPLIEEAVTEAVTAERERIIALVRDESPFHDYPDTAAFWRIHDQLADIIAASHRASVTPPTTPTEER